MSLAARHILKKELCLSSDEYRTVLRRTAGVESAKFLDEDGDRAVMRALYTIRDQRRAAEKERPKSPEERKVWGCGTNSKVICRRPSATPRISPGSPSVLGS